MKYLILLILLFTTTVRADQDNTEEVAMLAHMGTTYAATMVGYGIANKVLGLPKIPSLFLSSTVTMFGALWQESHHANNLGIPVNSVDMKNYAIGNALSIGTILFFDF